MIYWIWSIPPKVALPFCCFLISTWQKVQVNWETVPISFTLKTKTIWSYNSSNLIVLCTELYRIDIIFSNISEPDCTGKGQGHNVIHEEVKVTMSYIKESISQCHTCRSQGLNVLQKEVKVTVSYMKKSWSHCYTESSQGHNDIQE